MLVGDGCVFELFNNNNNKRKDLVVRRGGGCCWRVVARLAFFFLLFFSLFLVVAVACWLFVLVVGVGVVAMAPMRALFAPSKLAFLLLLLLIAPSLPNSPHDGPSSFWPSFHLSRPTPIQPPRSHEMMHAMQRRRFGSVMCFDSMGSTTANSSIIQ